MKNGVITSTSPLNGISPDRITGRKGARRSRTARQAGCQANPQICM